MPIESVMLPNHLILCLSSPFAFNLSQPQGLFWWVNSSHQMAKVLELQLHHQFLQWTPRVDFLLDWLVWSSCSPRDSQKSSPAPQFESINSSALSLLYGPTHIHTWLLGKIIALTRWTFVGKLISLLFNTLSRLVIAFLPRSKCLLISWLQSPSAVILNPKKIKSVTIFIVESLAIFKYKWWINNLNMWKDQHSSNTITLQIMLIYLEFFFFFLFSYLKTETHVIFLNLPWNEKTF